MEMAIRRSVERLSMTQKLNGRTRNTRIHKPVAKASDNAAEWNLFMIVRTAQFEAHCIVKDSMAVLMSPIGIRIGRSTPALL